MAYTPPTPADFKVSYPQFAQVPDATVQTKLDEAARWVDESWTEADFPIARQLYAAHILTLDGLGTGSEAKFAALTAGGLSSVKSGQLQLGLSKSGVETKKRAASSLYTTTFGQRFLELRRANKPGVAVLDGSN